MQFIFLLLFIFCSINVSAVEADAVASQTTKTVEQRLLELEEHKRVIGDWYNNEYLAGKGRMSPFLSESISFGGFFEGGITNIYGDDMKNQTTTNSQGLGINLTAIFSDKIRFVTQTLTVLAVPLRNPHNNPSVTPFPQRKFAGTAIASTVTQGYLEMSQNDFFNFQMGLGYVPFGYIFQQRELALFHKRGGPQMLGYADGVNVGIVSALWTGVHISGRLPFSPKRMGYNFYTFTTDTDVTELGTGGRLWWAENENFTLGFSLQAGPQVDSHYLTRGIDVDVKYDRYGFIAEYAYSDYSAGKLDAESYYIEPYMKFADGHWLVYVATDYLNVPARIDPFTKAADPITVWEHSVGVNWLPLQNVRLRLGYVKYDYVGETAIIKGQKRDWNSIDFSTGIAF
ncbi:hypothetical protein CIK05_02565 [Bdellovibrio sp. qaytius]|nr:hypothetical protein CIK05_02565 [Bdellovibrio sp. qaytius]